MEGMYRRSDSAVKTEDGEIVIVMFVLPVAKNVFWLLSLSLSCTHAHFHLCALFHKPTCARLRKALVPSREEVGTEMHMGLALLRLGSGAFSLLLFGSWQRSRGTV